MSKKVIGVIGTIGAGKDTAGDYLSKKLDIPSFQISSPLKRLLAESNQEPSRENLIALGTKLAVEKGEGYLAEYIIAHGPNSMIITGMRQLGQIYFLKSSTQLKLISIDASPEVRFQRVKQNGKIGEADTLEEFIEREIAENSHPNAQRLFECMDLADYQIINEGSLKELYSQLDYLIEKF